MTEQPPILDYARGVKEITLPWQTVVAIPLLVLTPSFACMCGYLDWEALPFSMGAAVFSWWGFFQRPKWVPWRFLALVVMVLASLLVGKNLADWLWAGHSRVLLKYLMR